MTCAPLQTRHVARIEEMPQVPWMIERLFLENAVGMLAGSPKALKTWFALEMALAVATQTPVLDTYAVSASGSVLLFAAEDTPQAIRARLSGMAAQRGVSLERAPIHLILAHSLRLDRPDDQRRLKATVEHLKPKLLVLDPFVRLSRVDENSSQEVSAVLAYLRSVQRELSVSILVVHHTRKTPSHGGRAGLALRGSGDFWAWSDTTLYLSRRDDSIDLLVEHRSAEDPNPLSFALDVESEHGPFLRVKHPQNAKSSTPSGQSLDKRILEHLTSHQQGSRTEAIREALRVRMQSLISELRQLEKGKRIVRCDKLWMIIPPASAILAVSHATPTPQRCAFDEA